MSITMILTDAGRAALLDKQSQGADVDLTHMVLGGGTTALDATATALTNELERQPIHTWNDGTPNQLDMEALFDADPVSPYFATEAGVIGDGVLFAVWVTSDPGGAPFPSDSLVYRMAGVPYRMRYYLGIDSLPSDNITIQTQPLDAAVQATFDDHIANANPHTQYVLKAGDTMTGALTLSGNAADDLHAVPKQQLEAHKTSYDHDGQYARKDGTNATGNWNIRAYPRRVGGNNLNFNWSGQGGQPPWLWGGSNGQDMYVYNPANFSVNNSAKLGNASPGTSATANTIVKRDSAGDGHFRLVRSNYPEQGSAPSSSADIAFRNNTSDNYIRFMTQAAMRSWLGGSVGVGQSWQVVSRSWGVNYTNSTGRPIAVAAWASGNTSTWSWIRLTIHGVQVMHQDNHEGINVFGIVPAGHWYRFDHYRISGYYSTIRFVELR